MAAGQPCETTVDEFFAVASKLNPANHIILEVCGQSAEPRYLDGDRWMIDISDMGYTPKKGVPAVFSDENGNYLKIYQGGDSFQSVNPDHKDLYPGESLKLVGYPVEKV